MPIGAKCVFTSQSARVTKMFASMDLSSMSVSFVGMMGDFAVWVEVPKWIEILHFIYFSYFRNYSYIYAN